MNSLITVDTDNAIVRVYSARAADHTAPNMASQLVDRLRRDAEGIAAALSYATGATFRVEVVR
jgi:hypothetical protein